MDKGVGTIGDYYPGFYLENAKATLLEEMHNCDATGVPYRPGLENSLKLCEDALAKLNGEPTPEKSD